MTAVKLSPVPLSLHEERGRQDRGPRTILGMPSSGPFPAIPAFGRLVLSQFVVFLLVLGCVEYTKGSQTVEMTAADISSTGHLAQGDATSVMNGPGVPTFRAGVPRKGIPTGVVSDEIVAGDAHNELDLPYLDEAAILSIQEDAFLETRKHQETNPNEQRPYYAACPFYDKLVSAYWGCRFMQASRAILTQYPGNFSTVFSSKMPANPSGDWPQVLTDLRPDPPFEVPKALIEHERGTFYWLFRHVSNLYKYAYRVADLGKAARLPPVPPGWSEQRLLFIQETDPSTFSAAFADTPLAETMMHWSREAMLVVIRGTMSAEEWSFDFQVSTGSWHAIQFGITKSIRFHFAAFNL